MITAIALMFVYLIANIYHVEVGAFITFLAVISLGMELLWIAALARPYRDKSSH